MDNPTGAGTGGLLPVRRHQICADGGDPRPDLRAAGARAEHRSRSRRAFRSGLRGVLCHWRLRAGVGVSVSGAGILVDATAGGADGRGGRRLAWLSGAAHARRLSGHCDPWFW